MKTPYLIEILCEDKWVIVNRFSTQGGRDSFLGNLRKQDTIHKYRASGKTKKKFSFRQRTRIDLKIYKYLSGCRYCGSDKKLTFHHVLKKQKNINASKFLNELACWTEVNKCEIVCRKCHNIIHDSGRTITPPYFIPYGHIVGIL